MSWHEDFEGTEDQFDDYCGIWHADNCGLPFAQFKATAWQVCQNGHTYWSDGSRWWCRPFMAGVSITDVHIAKIASDLQALL